VVRTRFGGAKIWLLPSQQKEKRLHLIVKGRQTAESIKDGKEPRSVPVLAIAKRYRVRLYWGGHSAFGRRQPAKIDLSPDNKLLPTSWEEQFKIATTGAFRELTRMREEGIIKGWGLGVNRPEPILRLLEVADPDVCLLASQYSLIDHKNALNNVFPAATQKNVSFVVGSSLNAGFISGSARYNYGADSYKIPPVYIEKRKRLREVAANHGVDLRTAALQFSAAPDLAAALVVGVSRERQILEDYTSMQTKIPAEFWADLKSQNLIEQNAPTPV
jgi:D-threo-aldose 1-dehydrogenase